MRHQEPRSVVAEYMASGKRPKTATVASHVARHFATATRKESQSKQRPGWRCFATADYKDENVIASTSPEREARHRTSCYMLQASKTYHLYERDREEVARLQNAPLDEREIASIKRREHYARKHEATLARRRVNDAYMQVTAAQMGTHAVHPNDTLADDLAAHGQGWMINNKMRQELDARGVPVMTHLMRGDYYKNDCARLVKTSFIEINKRQVRAASATLHRSMEQQQQTKPARHDRLPSPVSRNGDKHASRHGKGSNLFVPRLEVSAIKGY